MKRLRFLPEPLLGASLSLTLTQGSQSRSVEIPVFGQVTPPEPTDPPVPPVPTGDATVQITAFRADQQVAPEGMRFTASVEGFNAQPSATEVFDPTMHDLFYVWSFGDSGSYTAPENMLSAWRDKTLGYGPFPSHVYDAPGTYEVRVDVYERASGKHAWQTLSLTVGDAETAFPNGRTICVATDGDFTGAPAGAQQFTTWAEGETAYKRLNLPGRLLFSSRAPTPLDSNVINDSYPNCYFSAFGGGRAQIDCIGGSSMFQIYAQTLPHSGAVFHNLDMRGNWDSTTELGPAGKGIRILGGGQVTAHNCSASGLEVGFGLAGNDGDQTVIFSNCISTNWQSYGFFLATNFAGRYALLGCRAAQHVDALQGGAGKSSSDRANWHGPIRVQGCAQLYVDCFDGFSRNTWGAQGVVPPDQSVIRDHRNNNNSRGYFCRMVLEGGLTVYGNGSASPDQTGVGGFHQACNTVFENAYVLGSARSTSLVGITSSAFTGRNIILHRPDVPTGSQKVGAHVQIGTNTNEHGDYAPTSLVAPIRFYNCVAVNDLTDANAEVTNWNAFFDRGPNPNVELANNIVHAPNSSVFGTTADAPLDTTPLADIVPRYKGYRWREHNNRAYGDQFDMLTQYATPTAPNPVSLFQPDATSPAVGDADGALIAPTDFFGALRSGMPDGQGGIVPGTASRGVT